MSEPTPPWGASPPQPPQPSHPGYGCPPTSYPPPQGYPPPGYGSPQGYGGPPGYPPPGYGYGYGYGPGPYGYAGGAPSAAQRLGYVDAPFWERVGAALLDGLIEALFLVPLVALLVVWLVSTYDTEQSICTNEFGRDYACDVPTGSWFAKLLISYGLVIVGSLVSTIVYRARTEGRTGQSWGKRVVGLRTIDAQTAQTIGTGRIIGRVFGRGLSGSVCYLGFLWMLWDKDKQTWHDKMVRSIVVKA